MHKINYRKQRTLARPVEVAGVGYLTGKVVRLRFRPAPASTGVVFVRTDLHEGACLRACVANVTGTARRTTLGQPPLTVSLVEHVLAALAGMHVDNCYVELNAAEPPGLDGSARGFVDAVCRAGIVAQDAPRPIYGVTESVVLRGQGATLALHPGQGQELRASYFLDYGPQASIPRQVHTQVLTPAGFRQNLAACRTFLLEKEVEHFRQQGLGLATEAKDLLVFGAKGPIDNALRYGNEPARHKVLDMVGDLALLECDLVGHVVACRSGHPLNVELARTLAARLEQRHGVAA